MPMPCRLAPTVLLAAVLWTSVGAPHAAGGGSSSGGEDSPEFKTGLEAIRAQRWADAIRAFGTHLSRAGNDADAHNWLGYAYRNSGNLPKAFTHYRRALSIDPNHKGVHEYLGEAYLMEGKVAEAEAHLAKLASICNSACEEYEDLKKAIAAKKAP